MINIPYRASCYIARRNRTRFIRSITSLPRVEPARTVAGTVYSFSGEVHWPEQVASIRSFLRYVGSPERFVVISDGSYTDESRSRLEALSPCVSVTSYESVIRPDLPMRVREYASQHFMGKKLALLLSLPIDGPTIYTDSDILFFPGAEALVGILECAQRTPRYLLDCLPSFDARLLAAEQEGKLPANAGFLVFPRMLDWGAALDRLEDMEGDCTFFTEQTLIHLAMRSNQGQPLPADQFVLRVEDQFVFSDFWAKPEIVLRHYVTSIRNKFWHQTALFS
jgi:hypothetical protein